MMRKLALAVMSAFVFVLTACADEGFTLYHIVPYAAPGTEVRTAHDMVEYRERTGCDLALYSLTLDPEGKPAMGKVRRYLASYRALRRELEGTGVRLGVLVQAILGHWKRVGKEMEDWTRTVNVKGEKVRYCPDDPDFAQYITDTFTLIAKERPAFVLTDDDVRAYSHDAECFCPRHVAEFNRRRGTALTEAEVRERVRAAKQDDEDYRVFLAVQRDMMHRLVRRFRDALDSIDPTIPAGICMSGEETFLAGPLACILAAKGLVPVMRIGNGCYRERYGTDLAPNIFRTLGYAEYYGDSGIRLLDEADTCPQNLWSKSAIGFFTHLQVAAFSGFSGAKVWYVNGHKTDGTEVSRNYTDVLAENRGVLNAIVRELGGTSAAGLAVPCFTNFPNWHLARNHSEMFTAPGTFAERVLIPFGIPFRLEKDFDRDGTYLVSTAAEVTRFADADLERLFSHRVLVTADAAVALSERGRSDLIGLSAVREALACSVERDNRTGQGWGYGYADKPVRLFSLAEGAEALTTVGFRPYAGSPDFTAISPGAVRFKNRLGGTVVTTVYHGNMFAYSQFSTARKDYLLGLAGLLDASVTDFTCGNDQDVLVQARCTASDTALVLATNLNGEPIRSIRFRVPEGLRTAEVLSAGGQWRALAARQEGGWLVLDEPLAFTQTKVFRFSK